jgi:hypothetical protein
MKKIMGTPEMVLPANLVDTPSVDGIQQYHE